MSGFDLRMRELVRYKVTPTAHPFSSIKLPHLLLLVHAVYVSNKLVSKYAFKKRFLSLPAWNATWWEICSSLKERTGDEFWPVTIGIIAHLPLFALCYLSDMYIFSQLLTSS